MSDLFPNCSGGSHRRGADSLELQGGL